VRLIDRIEHKFSNPEDFPGTYHGLIAGQCEDRTFSKFIAAGGVSALVHVAVTGWPADGNLAASQHPYDKATDVPLDAVEHETEPQFLASLDTMMMESEKRPGPKWRSPRRMAIVCLADMGHYK
jgi:hypothetical protein